MPDQAWTKNTIWTRRRYEKRGGKQRYEHKLPVNDFFSVLLSFMRLSHRFMHSTPFVNKMRKAEFEKMDGTKLDQGFHQFSIVALS